MRGPSLLLRWAVVLGSSFGLGILLLLMLVRAAPSAGLVYSQFTGGGGRTWVYLDPFRGREVERPVALHDEAAVEPPETSPRSPDGTRQVVPRVTAAGVDLFVLAANGTEMRLTGADQLAASGDLSADRRSNTSPLWSPDGEWISFISTGAQATMELYIVRADGTRMRRVSEGVSTPMPLGLRWLELPEANFQPWPALALLWPFTIRRAG